ncbi:DUF4871 domain-containing protein [Bacillus sp. 3255]|uniref:DUF4871 domain-containing protein n=1 Tax=Bacillus sp. 3255 TaxID=2817904 RepID=UPI002860F456|nr:DUF4871 domain-containing protein [Bacillus sp. 3255]MDR6879819.1 hypothetical protein [Bacillus sp. 3255]
MKEDKPLWAEQLADSPFTGSHFTRTLANQIRSRTREVRRRRFKRIALASLIPAVMLLLFVVIEVRKDASFSFIAPLIGTSNVAVDGNRAYTPDGRLLFSVAAEPGAQAGVTNGYIFHFEAPFQTFYGKTLTVEAIHMRTGIRETVSSENIQQPSSGYPGLERYAIRFALPLEGQWELQVKLDDTLYGSVKLALHRSAWDVAPLFQANQYWLRGVENRIGFIDAGFEAGKVQKYMWHFWGTDEQLNGPFEVKAVKEGSDTLITVFASDPLSSANALGGELNGADRHLPTSMMLPEAGRWRLLPYVRGMLLDPIVVQVN